MVNDEYSRNDEENEFHCDKICNSYRCGEGNAINKIDRQALDDWNRHCINQYQRLCIVNCRALNIDFVKLHKDGMISILDQSNISERTQELKRK